MFFLYKGFGCMWILIFVKVIGIRVYGIVGWLYYILLIVRFELRKSFGGIR